jgi:uncharacterized protein YjiS (DUF1127 family)
MSFLNLSISVVKGFSAWRRRERAYAELMALDDRSLADIGILRSQIHALEEGARKQTEFPMNNLTPDHPTLLATRQHADAEFVVKNTDAAHAPANLFAVESKTVQHGCTGAVRPHRHSSHAAGARSSAASLPSAPGMAKALAGRR